MCLVSWFWRFGRNGWMVDGWFWWGEILVCSHYGAVIYRGKKYGCWELTDLFLGKKELNLELRLVIGCFMEVGNHFLEISDAGW